MLITLNLKSPWIKAKQDLAGLDALIIRNSNVGHKAKDLRCDDG